MMALSATTSTDIPATTVTSPAMVRNTRAKRQFSGPRGWKLPATGLRQCWRESGIREMTVARVEWYEHETGTNHLMLFQLAFPAALHKKDIWIRLERCPEHPGLRYTANRPKSLVGQLTGEVDVAIVSSNKGGLFGGEGESFSLKQVAEGPIPFSFVLDVLDLACQNSSSDMNDSWLYASFIMSAMHRFSKAAGVPLGECRCGTPINYPHRILKDYRDRRTPVDTEHDIILRHDWVVVDWEEL
ncbi:hypothetical protein FRC08_015681 [Ceratobasidium sp. 394]|nr:hypothetical protein FRC08_015681 [Ceratobasidium sp. 394]